MLRMLSQEEKEDVQKRGYMCEHLLCLYSMVSNQTALYNEDFPVFFNRFREADVILFGLRNGDRFDCVQELIKLPIDRLNIVSPLAFQGLPNLRTRYVDWDYHINVDSFDFNLRGKKYKNIRHRLRQAEKRGYRIRLSRDFTPDHTYILSRHMGLHKFDVWDYEELLSLERFFREHDHGLMIEAYKDGMMIGFDVVDFFEENRIMVVPLGVYLEDQLVSDFMMYENLKFARDRGYEWLDVGSTCGVEGLKRFKEKWFAEPKFKIFVHTLKIDSKSDLMTSNDCI